MTVLTSSIPGRLTEDSRTIEDDDPYYEVQRRRQTFGSLVEGFREATTTFAAYADLPAEAQTDEQFNEFLGEVWRFEDAILAFILNGEDPDAPCRGEHLKSGTQVSPRGVLFNGYIYLARREMENGCHRECQLLIVQHGPEVIDLDEYGGSRPFTFSGLA